MSAAEGQTAPAPVTVARGAALKIVGSVLAVVGAAGAVLYMSALPGGEYYKHVDEVMSNVDQLRGKHLQVHGYVVKDSILQKRGSLEYKFKLETRAPRAAAVIEAEYRGLVPDTFKSDAEVVAKGTITADNRLTVVPDGISAKCPTKYKAGEVKLSETAGAPPNTAQR
jgi:cytochrome c-type biogenesis protein CcmE